MRFLHLASRRSRPPFAARGSGGVLKIPQRVRAATAPLSEVIVAARFGFNGDDFDDA